MLLNEAEKLGVLYERTLRIMELAFTELRLSTFESWMWLNGDRIFEARFREKGEHEEEKTLLKHTLSGRNHGKEQGEREREGTSHTPFIMAFPPLHETREMADFVRDSFRWRWRSTTCPPRLLPDDYQDLCPRFMLSDVESAALEFELLEMVKVIFYAMPLKDAVELGIVSGSLVVDLKLTLEGLRWTSFEAWLSRSS
ncbi:hypothetical protein Cgig2_025498 [Carnegiea gigantea]|uniref:Uncharacterized protein n=1 Tax=Carnegiea gigantea TaxID=171969 RepID=A0A9Q1GVL9_9CARY|nr:hypothetical protein Cgig2_025498 [Carnegiea gigantea]